MGLFNTISNGVANTVNKLLSPESTSQYERPLNGRSSPELIGEPVRARRTPARQETVCILVIGRSGSGKTYFIDYACASKQSGVLPSHQATADVESRRARYSGVTFKLIDTPGFDGLTLSDTEVFTRIANYFLNPSRMGQGINGIIYIHQAGDTLQSRTLARNLELLSDLFLGKNGLARLTIFVSQSSARGIDPTTIIEEMRRPGSVFGAACAAGASIMTPRANRTGFMEAIMSYASDDPIILPVQQHALNDSRSNFLARLDESTWYYEKESVERRVKDVEAHYKKHYRANIQELESSLSNKELKLSQYHEAYSESEKLRANQQETAMALRQQLQESQQEYASLRSQLQLQDNFEQSEIVQNLKDLNREIDDIGRLISAHLADNHVQATFGRDLTDITAMDAHDLPGLKSLLRHTDGRSSLIASSGGVGMDVESFLDFSIRTLLCALLITKIFQPFHPGIDPSQGEALLMAYKDIQKQEPQSVAGKWRSSTFKSIYRPEKPDVTVDHINTLTHEFVRDGLGPLITLFFGRKDPILERQHFNCLHKLITRAWDWNSRLKGEVIMLGDFEQIAYIPPTSFDVTLMEEFEPNPRKPPAESVLGTLALGLVSRRAVGGGQPPEETLVCKALVATNNMYA